MNNIELLATEVLNMRSLQIEHSKLKNANRYGVYRKVDKEELAEAYKKMRDAEKKVHEMCLDILGVEEGVDYD